MFFRIWPNDNLMLKFYRIIFSNFVGISWKCYWIGREAPWGTIPFPRSQGRKTSSLLSVQQHPVNTEGGVSTATARAMQTARQGCPCAHGDMEFHVIIMKCPDTKAIDKACTRPIQQKTFTMVYISFLLIPWNCPYCRFLMDEIWNWADSFFLQNYGINLLNFLSYC